MTSKRIHVYFSQEHMSTFNKLEQRRTKKGQASWGDVIHDLQLENDNFMEQLSRQSNMEEALIAAVEKVMLPIKMRTGYTDKNTRIMMELLNGLMYHWEINDLIGSDILVTNPVAVASEKVTKDINSTVKRNLEKKKIREANLNGE